MTQHRCQHPLAHRLLAGSAVLLWVSLFALWLIPQAVYHLTGSGSWAWVSVGCALTVGLLIVKGLAYWRCQPLQQGWGLRPFAHLMLTAWALREDR